MVHLSCHRQLSVRMMDLTMFFRQQEDQTYPVDEFLHHQECCGARNRNSSFP